MAEDLSGKKEGSPPPPPIKRQSSITAQDDHSGGSMMHLLTGKGSKVAPAVAGHTGSETFIRSPVPLLNQKKSDAVCVEMPPIHGENQNQNQGADQENNAAPKEGCPVTGCCSQGHCEAVAVKPTQSYDSYEEVCRICHDNPSKLELISPCLCKGSMNKVHRTCLERWLGESAKNSCEICGYEYNTVRKPKYTGCRSIYQWIRHPLSPSDTRNLFFDIACFFILTPLAAISSWLCVVGAQHYTFGEERRRRSKYGHDSSLIMNSRLDPRAEASNATWTSVGLLSLTGTLLVAYSVWLFVAIKYHIQAWRDWQQRNFTVTIVPFEDGCMGRPPPPRPARQATPSGNNNLSSSNQMGERSSSSNNNNSNPYNFFSSSAYGGYDHLGVSSYLRYNGPGSLGATRGRGRNLVRHGGRRSRNRDTYLNLPPIFSRSHFLRNPPPGYTISETALLYQALYGTDSDTALNDNFLAFFADSSEDVTEASSIMMGGGLPPTMTTGAGPESPVIQAGSEVIPEVHTTRSASVADTGVESSSSSKDKVTTPPTPTPAAAPNNNNSENVTETSSNKGPVEPEPQLQPQAPKSSETTSNGNNDVVIRIESGCNEGEDNSVKDPKGEEIV